MASDASPFAGSYGRDKARECLSRQDQLEHVRRQYEDVWRAVMDYCAPDAPDVVRQGLGGRLSDNQASRTDRRTRRTYDTTVRTGQRRLCAGLESLITPQSDKWHGLSTAAFDDEETDEEREYCEGVRDFLFGLRYSAGSGFVTSIQQVYANVVRFGPAYLYPEESFDTQLIRYRSLPVGEGWISRNKWGEVDTFHRRYERTARICAQMFGDRTPKKILEMARDPKRCDEKVELLHCIYPDAERRAYPVGDEYRYLDGPFQSLHIIVGEEAVVRERSFASFPVATFSWNREDGDDYGTSPVIELLTEVREINAVRRSTLRGIQQMVDPAIATAEDVDTPLWLDPGSRHPGLINEQGRPLFAPMNTGQRIDYALNHIEASKQTINQGLYVDLFQILVQNPQMTATEALIRAEEKGALLGPAGSSIQAGLATQVDREMSILEHKGFYAEGSRFVPPESLQGKPLRVKYTSPLDMLRMAGEARATQEALAAAGQIAAMGKPDVMDNLDVDEAYRVIVGASRAPARILHRKDEVTQTRQQRAQAEQAQAGLAAMAGGADIAAKALPAMAKAADSGLLPGVGAQA